MFNRKTAIVSLFLLIATIVGAHKTYCPASSDLLISYVASDSKVTLNKQGWKIVGGGAAATKASFNLLGGSVEYDIDVSGVKNCVNSNIYTISPTGISSTKGFLLSGYCDGAKAADNGWCVEVDWIETNGVLGGQTTLHTIAGTGSGCTAWGCAATYYYSGTTSFHMKITYATDGTWKTYRNGVLINLSTTPLASDWKTLATQYKERGAVIYSSQWTGWVPINNCSPAKGALASSSFTIKNLKIIGTVVQGPTPTVC